MDFIAKAAVAIFAPILTLFVLALGGSVIHLGELSAIFGVAYAITGLLITKYLRGRYLIIVISYGLLTIYSLLLLNTNSIPILYFVIFLGGVATAFKKPAFTEITFDHIERDIYMKTSSFYYVVCAILTAAFSYLGGSIIHHGSSPMPHLNGDILVFKNIFLAMVFMFGTSFFYSIYFRKRFKHHAKLS